MQNKVKIAVIALCYAPLALAQTNNVEQKVAKNMDENAFTFTEAQLGEDDNMSQNVTILNSNSNVYASEVGYLFSPVRFRYRAFNQKYNDIYINGAPMNDMETGQFRYSGIGGLNRFTRNVDFALPFESNNFSMPGMAGSNNYDLRAGSMGAGHYVSVGAANRNYTLRGMYTYASGFNSKGWAVAAGLTYRWANHGYVEGTFYNALSYYFGVQKKWNNGHSLAFSTWGNPTERSTQGASTDEAYWLANDYQYNPYWGYQNGHKRNSRVVNDFAPSALFTWDWDINDDMKLENTACTRAPDSTTAIPKTRNLTIGSLCQAALSTCGEHQHRHRASPCGRRPTITGPPARPTDKSTGTTSTRPTGRMLSLAVTHSTMCRPSTTTT